ncbi:MAG: hypothetical protein FD123_3291 [Bacteroidetes bacterium]|nr:MAG: hypothetical protein FD123_3291 [Bacteroidota bacterium]
MKKLFLSILLMAGLSTRAVNPVPAQENAAPDMVYLGFSLMPGANSSLVTYKIVRVYNGPSVRYEQINISRHDFLSIAMGLVESEANPKKENLFVKYEIKDCGYQLDTIIRGIKYDFTAYCPVIDDLWRLRWGEYPFQRKQGADDPGPGWAADKLGVSEGQFNMLKEYGMSQSYNDPIFGEAAFRLLRDMQSPSWQSRYRGS